MVQRAFNVVLDETAEKVKNWKISAGCFSSSQKFEKSIKELVSTNIIDGDQLSNLLFNLEDVDAFISYSHKDKDLASKFASFLQETFNLKVFLDCNTWRSSDQLLKVIDEKYCKNNDNKTYSYEKRNISTSHIHSMLSTAIFKQITKSKFVFFLNTQNSVPTVNSSFNEKNTTLSPWIYEEIVFTETLIKLQGKTTNILDENCSLYYSGPQIARRLPLDDFTKLGLDDLCVLEKRKEFEDSIKLFKNY